MALKTVLGLVLAMHAATASAERYGSVGFKLSNHCIMIGDPYDFGGLLSCILYDLMLRIKITESLRLEYSNSLFLHKENRPTNDGTNYFDYRNFGIGVNYRSHRWVSYSLLVNTGTVSMTSRIDSEDKDTIHPGKRKNGVTFQTHFIHLDKLFSPELSVGYKHVHLEDRSNFFFIKVGVVLNI